MKKIIILSKLFVLTVVMASVASAQPARNPPGGDPAFAPGGALSCLGCHNQDSAPQILQTAHAVRADSRTPFADHDCESCHGASPEHRRQPRIPVTVVFNGVTADVEESPVATQNQACLSCHESGARMHWRGSAHDFAELPCTACHDIHARQDSVLATITQPNVCFGCHVEQRAQLQRRSHHPVREGLMTCSDCHNSHGSVADNLLSASNLLEACTECHAEKRGPFLWEHQPVSEDCTNCHNPHGSTQARLLSVRQPFLCQGCHQEVFHPSSLYSGTGVPPAGAAQQLLGQSCTNCHSQVHGSNHPSGSRLTR